VVILAAGLGTRMRSRTPKELQPILGRPMIDYVLDAAAATGAGQRIAVLSPSKAQLAESLPADVNIAWQDEPLGTGHAALSSLPQLDAGIEHVVVLFGDHPLLSGTAVVSLVDAATASGALVTLLTTVVDDPAAYGRVRRRDGRIEAIVEAKDDSEAYDGAVEIYSGISCYKREWLESTLPSLPKSAAGEFYLTGLIRIAATGSTPGDAVIAVRAEPDVAYGVNDRVDLARAERIIRRRVNERLMRSGVAIVDPDSTIIEASVSIGIDTTIEPGVILRGATSIGEDCRIGPHSVLQDTRVGDGSEIVASHLEGATVGARCHVGPFSHLRPGATLDDDVHVGNYAEIKNAVIGRLTHVGHFSYIGDADLGEDVNIGAGTVTCNFDGVSKQRTVIGPRAFIGSDTMLVAPVTVGEAGRTGAGSVVNRDVPPGETVAGVPARVVQRSKRSSNSEREGS
jgi:bifunctional UDP-N-acetylglucosamine pyrophosphorylase / glucosamine-1-phosphate N-acetyltransferase